MIFVIIKINALPEKCQEFFQTIGGIVARTRKKRGCINCHFYRDAENENTFGLVEEWETQADLDSHLQSDDIAVFRASMDFLSEPPDIKFSRLMPTNRSEVLTNVEAMMQN